MGTTTSSAAAHEARGQAGPVEQRPPAPPGDEAPTTEHTGTGQEQGTPIIDERSLPAGASERLEGLLQKLASRRRIRHTVLAIGDEAGSPLWMGAAGAADEEGRPMTPETPFWLASVTKLYIAAATLRLYEQGRLELDAAMADYLPDELVAGLHRWKGADLTGEITVRHLLGHASGLQEYLLIAPDGAKTLFDRAVEEGLEWGIREITDLVREQGTPVFPPRPFDGRRHTIRYSDTNFQLLIAIIETVSGQPVETTFETLLFRPLGLTRTFHPATPAAERDPRPASVWAGDDRLDAQLGAMRSFRDLYGTAEETLRFMAALVGGRVFDDPATGRLMSAHFNPFGFSFTLRPVGPSSPAEYGLGMMRLQLPRLFSPLRAAPALYGHTGVSGSWLFHCPDLRLTLSGTVDQIAGAAVPFRFVPRLVRQLDAMGVRGT